MSEEQTLYCINHPDRETYLRCNQCEQPICPQCAIQTPTGYRCRSCVQGQQKKFNTAQVPDFFLAPLIALVLSLIGSYLVSFLGFFTVFASPIAGMVIERAVRGVIKNRRSNSLFIVIAAGAALGSLPRLLAIALPMFSALVTGGFSFYFLLPAIWQIVYSVLTTSAVYYRLKGISF